MVYLTNILIAKTVHKGEKAQSRMGSKISGKNTQNLDAFALVLNIFYMQKETKKKIGEWLMDIAKYMLTAVVISN